LLTFIIINIYQRNQWLSFLGNDQCIIYKEPRHRRGR
jgi:hypothetical protein